MALGFYFSPASLNAQQYDEIIKRLEEAGAGRPAGRSYPASFGTPDRLAVFEVWDAQGSFDKFVETLMPILQANGVDPGTSHVMPVHNVING